MSLGDVVNHLHDEHCFSYAGTTEQTDFTTFRIRLEQVDYLYTSVKDFGGDCQVGEFRSRLVDGTAVGRFEFFKVVDRLSDNVKQTAFHLFASGNSDRRFGVCHLHATLQAVGTVHGHTANCFLSDVLLNLKHESRAVFALYMERSVNGRNLIVLALK